MMRFALVTILLAVLGGIWLALPASPHMPGNQAGISKNLQLWRAPPAPEFAQEAQVSLPSTQAPCAKIGLFPRQEWAERAHLALWMNEEVVRHTVLTSKMNYYLVYPGLSRDELESQLERRRLQTDGLISKRVHAESC